MDRVWCACAPIALRSQGVAHTAHVRRRRKGNVRELLDTYKKVCSFDPTIESQPNAAICSSPRLLAAATLDSSGQPPSVRFTSSNALLHKLHARSCVAPFASLSA